MRIGLVHFTVSVLLLASWVCAGAGSEGKRLGDGDDGSRTNPVHLIPLFDKNGVMIRAEDEKAQPFSIRNKTCGDCHSYNIISRGWHFNSADSNVPPGRSGEPWVMLDADTRTVVPISSRGWPGTFNPEQLGIGPWQFLKNFATHTPGGDYGEIPDENEPEAILKGKVAGSYEINCLACHSADRRQDQSAAALQAFRQNYQWMVTGGSGLAMVQGSVASLPELFDPQLDEIPITVSYDKSRFNKKNEVFFDIVHKPPNQRCYFCHSTQDLKKAGQMKWTDDEDVHLAAGLSCVDCHRNGIDHKIARGYECEASANKPAVTLSCKGCHLGEGASEPVNGRLGAPVPKHAGIPPVHFEKLTCTACHAGNWPEKKAGLVKTARIHKLGLHGEHRVDLRLPHVAASVFIKGQDGKIGPYKLIWPAFWGRMKNEIVVPLSPQVVKEIAADVLGLNVRGTETVNDFRPLKPEQIAEVLKLLRQQKEQQGEAIYVCGGKLYRLDDRDRPVAAEHQAAGPYAWPIAHDVRPAAQSLGVRSCQDCHSTDSSFFFGQVAVDSPVVSEQGSVKRMIEFEKLRPFYTWAFAASFVFRPYLKIVAIGSCAILAGVLLLYALKALACIAKILVGKE